MIKYITFSPTSFKLNFFIISLGNESQVDYSQLSIKTARISLHCKLEKSCDYKSTCPQETEWNESAGFICDHVDVAQTQTTVAVHETDELTRPPLSEMDNSETKYGHNRTKDRANGQLRAGLERLMLPKVAFLCKFGPDFELFVKKKKKKFQRKVAQPHLGGHLLDWRALTHKAQHYCSLVCTYNVYIYMYCCMSDSHVCGRLKAFNDKILNFTPL